MGPKKDKGKKEEEKGPGVFNEVEKTFLELQITECNRKIARLRAAVDEYEARNEELQKAYDKMDEDRADIIAYLKKTLTIKNEENNELKEKVKGLEEIRDIENAQFHAKVTELERNFTIMKDQLTSENKLLAGKLNTLEEFRAIRDDLMKKFDKQEEDFKNQEMKYKRIIYDAEKKFVIGKDKLKKEMEARLLQLAQDFQDATELRVAASTHRVIRENIAISNELDCILASQEKVSEQNEQFKQNVRAAIIAKELAEEERDKAINKSVVQLKIIEQLTSAFENVKKERVLFEKRSYDFETLQAKIQKLTQDNDNLALQVRILEQNLHTRLSAQNKAVVEALQVSKERDKFRKILEEAAFAIQAALKLDQWANTDPARAAMDRQLLLSNLLEIVSQYREIQGSDSVTTIGSFSKVYEEGDLGFIPKTKLKKKVSRLSTISVPQSLRQQETSKDASMKSLLTESEKASSSVTSIQTIPNIEILPESQVEALEEKKSIESFVTSAQSTISEEQESEQDEAKTEMEKKLLASKLEIQKSILKDLAFSQSALKMAAKPSETFVTKKKSVIIAETIEEMDKAGHEPELSDVPEDDTVGEGLVESEDAELAEAGETEKSPSEAQEEKDEAPFESETEELKTQEDKQEGA